MHQIIAFFWALLHTPKWQLILTLTACEMLRDPARHLLAKLCGDKWIPGHYVVTDFTVQSEGNVFLLHPRTKIASAWLDDFLIDNREAQFSGDALVIEQRRIASFVTDLCGEGFGVRT